MATATSGGVGYLKATSNSTHRYPAGQKYPWPEWADGQVWHLTRGEDYGCTTATMIDNAVKYARRHGLRVSRQTTHGGVKIQFRLREKVESE